MTEHLVWDRFIRLFHILLATGFVANATLIEDGTVAHDWIGYALAGLILLRLVWGVLGPYHARFASFPRGRAAIRDQLRNIARNAPRTHLGHSPLGALMVANLLFSILAICATGVSLGLPAHPDWAETVHESLTVWVSICIIFHVLAVIWESARTRINLIKAMITGRKHVPDTIHIIE